MKRASAWQQQQQKGGCLKFREQPGADQQGAKMAETMKNGGSIEKAESQVCRRWKVVGNRLQCLVAERAPRNAIP
jgi:hypothetical protein